MTANVIEQISATGRGLLKLHQTLTEQPSFTGAVVVYHHLLIDPMIMLVEGINLLAGQAAAEPARENPSSRPAISHMLHGSVLTAKGGGNLQNLMPFRQTAAVDSIHASRSLAQTTPIPDADNNFTSTWATPVIISQLRSHATTLFSSSASEAALDAAENTGRPVNIPQAAAPHLSQIAWLPSSETDDYRLDNLAPAVLPKANQFRNTSGSASPSKSKRQSGSGKAASPSTQFQLPALSEANIPKKGDYDHRTPSLATATPSGMRMVKNSQDLLAVLHANLDRPIEIPAVDRLATSPSVPPTAPSPTHQGTVEVDQLASSSNYDLANLPLQLLDALADELEIAYLRMYGTSGSI